MNFHIMKAHELMDGELILLNQYKAEMAQRFAETLQSRAALADQLTVTRENRKQAARPPSEEELKVRRLAERDQARRPEGLIRARRHSGWQRRLLAAEQRERELAERKAQADHAALLRDELISYREAAARAAARRHYEFALRRIATYQQQLIRSHDRGSELNQLLIEHPVGPDLPDWTKDPPGAAPMTGEPPGGEERSGT